MTSSLHELTALEAVNAIRAGQITASAYTNALLSQIEAREGEVQAWQYLDPREAREQAAKLDARGDLKSLPLPGAAVGVKDIIDTADMRPRTARCWTQGGVLTRTPRLSGFCARRAL